MIRRIAPAVPAVLGAGLVAIFALVAAASSPPEKPKYPWLDKYDASASLSARFQPPAGYARLPVEAGSYEDWLRRLPLKPAGAAVHLYDGRLSIMQESHAAVIDIDVGAKDLMQCADTVIRLRAEYLYSANQFEAIHFNFTSGDRADFIKWAEGYKPVVNGSAVTWVKGAAPGTGYQSFRAYLDVVFNYAGTVSLAKELKAVPKVEDIRIGDVFIQPGSPGHAITVVDVAAQSGAGGKKVFLLVQGYMPAQEPHVLKNPATPALDPWYPVDFGDTLRTPQWVFKKSDLKRF
jgi:hypothetical protein